MEIIANVQQTLSIFAGFTVTMITLLVTLFPNPSNILAQVTLFTLNLVFDLLLFIILWNVFGLRRFSKFLQGTHLGSVRAGDVQDALSILAVGLCGVSISLMFLLINLTYLAIASGAMWIIWFVACWIVMWKPYKEYLKRLQQ